MGLWARYPIATAPGMGLNAFFAFTVVLTLGIPWQTALTGTLISGVLFFVLAVTGAREAIINAIPPQLKLAVGAGIGLFIAFIGLKSGGIVVASEATLVTIGDFQEGTVLLTVFGLLVTAVFMVLGWKGGVFYGMLATLVLGVLTGVIDLELADGFTPNLDSFGAAFTGFEDAFTVHMIAVILTMLFVDFFDTAGTLFAVAGQAGLVKDGKLPRAGRALATDSIATSAGAVLGTSTTTAYIESTAGVSVGGRTGLTAVTTGFWFLVSLVAFPVFGLVANNPAVTAPALIIVGVLMAKALGQIEWERLEYAIPAFLIVAVMPLTYSISNGIAMGLVFFPIMMAAKGRWRKCTRSRGSSWPPRSATSSSSPNRRTKEGPGVASRALFACPPRRLGAGPRAASGANRCTARCACTAASRARAPRPRRGRAARSRSGSPTPGPC